MGDRWRGNRSLRVQVLLAAVLALLLPVADALAVEQAPTVRLSDSEVGTGAVLASGAPLHLRVRYRSAVPIHILLSGYYRGDVVQDFRQDAEEVFPAGDRAVTVWLAYPFAARIDHVQVRIWNRNNARLAEASFPFEVAWTDADRPEASAARLSAAWVAELSPGQQSRMAEIPNEPDESGGFDPFDLIFLFVPGYFLLQAVLAWRASNGWRKAASAPAVIMVPVVAYTVLAFAARSNLWPLPLLLTAPLAFVYLVVLSVALLLRRLAGAT